MKRTFKKSLSLVLAVLMAFAALPLVGATAACETHNYTYEPAMNGWHSYSCAAGDSAGYEMCTGGTATCKSGALCEKCGSEYTEKSDSHGTPFLVATEEYLSSAANCKYPAYYYLSCFDCGAIFEGMTKNVDNNVDPNNHQYVYTSKNDNGTHNAKCGFCDAVKTNEPCYDKEPVIIAAGCAEPGKKVSTCDVCGRVWEEAIAATGHDYSEKSGVKRSDATCTAFDTYWYKCSKCGANAKDDNKAQDKYYDGTSKLGHVYDQKNSDSKYSAVAANCQQAGEYYYSCACGASSKGTQGAKTFTTTKGNHVWNAGTPNGDAKCGIDGTKTVTCTVPGCGEVKTNEPDPGSALDHKFTREVETADRLAQAESSCLIANVYYFTCEYCDVWSTDAKDRFVGKTTGAHDFSGTDLKVIIALPNGTNYVKSNATCTQKAVFYKYCVACKASSKGTEAEATFEAGETKQHNYQAIMEDKYIRSQATCVDKAIYTVSCKDCGTPKIPDNADIFAPSYVVNPEDIFYGKELGHDMKKTKSHKDSTCVLEGNTEEQTCQRVLAGKACGFKTGGETIPKKEHVYEVTQEYRAPTCKTNGQYGQKKCKNCVAVVYLDANGETANILTQNMTATGHVDSDGDMICEKCDALLEAADLCTCICHNGESGGIMYFIVWILKWFWKLTNSNEMCACGEYHY